MPDYMEDFSDFESEEEFLDDEEFDALESPDEDYTEWHQGRIFGSFRAIVRDTSDPKKWGRIRVECPKLWGEGNLSPWLLPKGMGGGKDNCGFVDIPYKQDIVWIEFEEGERESGHWSYGPWFWESGKSMPKHAYGETDETDSGYKGKGVGFIPSSTASPEYPDVKLWKTRGGHMLEMDDTSGHERVQLWHTNGAHIEILTDGSINLSSGKDLKGASFGSKIRFQAMDATGNTLGNEFGANSSEGWLGTKSTATESVVCGDTLVAYLTALVTVLTTALTSLVTMWTTVANDTTFQSTFPGIVSKIVDPSGPVAAVTTAASSITALTPIYLQVPATNILSQTWKVVKLSSLPEP
jgi:hypothetical protein